MQSVYRRGSRSPRGRAAVGGGWPEAQLRELFGEELRELFGEEFAIDGDPNAAAARALRRIQLYSVAISSPPTHSRIMMTFLILRRPLHDGLK